MTDSRVLVNMTRGLKGKKGKKWISATINEEYSTDMNEGIDGLTEGDIVILESDGKWYKS